jgi:hypothetical protein
MIDNFIIGWPGGNSVQNSIPVPPVRRDFPKKPDFLPGKGPITLRFQLLPDLPVSVNILTSGKAQKGGQNEKIEAKSLLN